MRKINLIVLHCSATRETAEYTPEQLERDHRAPGIPYCRLQLLHPPFGKGSTDAAA